MQRDAIYLRIAKIFGCKVAVFIHGWDKRFYENIMSGGYQLNSIWHVADCFFVLAAEFEKDLRNLGIKNPVFLTTTKVTDKLVENFKRSPAEAVNNIIFLARVTKEKGIYVAIDAFEIVKRTHKDATLKVVGVGEELNNAMSYAKERGVYDITFTGALSGTSLREAFANADIYILPTAHEGMPTSVLEAMAFGLPVITRPVGGLVDFFEHGKMGYLIEELNSEVFAKSLSNIIENPSIAHDMATYNQNYSSRHFLASKVAPELEKTLKDL